MRRDSDPFQKLESPRLSKITERVCVCFSHFQSCLAEESLGRMVKIVRGTREKSSRPKSWRGEKKRTLQLHPTQELFDMVQGDAGAVEVVSESTCTSGGDESQLVRLRRQREVVASEMQVMHNFCASLFCRMSYMCQPHRFTCDIRTYNSFLSK